MTRPFRLPARAARLAPAGLCGLLALVSLECAPAPAQDPPPATNLLLITADDLSCDSVGVFGCPLPDITPHIDRLAAQGLRFERAHVSVSSCQPSRAALLTGLHPQRSGALAFDPVREGVATLPGILTAAGYHTGILAKIGHHKPVESFPFDVRIWANSLARGRSPELYGSRALEFFEGAQAAERPFFLLANIQDPHRPFPGSQEELLANRARNQAPPYPEPPPPIPADAVPVPPFLPDLPGVRTELAQYFAAVRRCDAVVGALLGALEDSGQAERTLVVFLSDNAMAFPFAKAGCYRFSTRTPLILRWPGKIAPGSVEAEHLVPSLDLLPTLLEALEIEPPGDLDGASLTALFDGGQLTGRERIFTGFTATSGGGQYGSRAVHDARFGYIFNAWSLQRRQFQNESRQTLTYKALLSSPFEEHRQRLDFFQRRSPEELYDYAADPGALHNLAANPAMGEELAQLRGALLAHLEQTGDPLAQRFATFVEARTKRD